MVPEQAEAGADALHELGRDGQRRRRQRVHRQPVRDCE